MPETAFLHINGILDEKVEKQKLSFYYNIKMKKFSFQRRLVYCIYKAQFVCALEVKELKNRFDRVREKEISYLPT